MADFFLSLFVFLYEKCSILIQIVLKFIPKSPMNNMQASVQLMAWHRTGDTPLSEPIYYAYMSHSVLMSYWK